MSSVVLAGVAVVLPALPAHASADALVAVDGTFTGTTGNDTLVIGNDGTNLTNNGFDLGAPGFESPLDFDSTVAGVQTRAIPGPIDYALRVSFDAGDGDDTLKIRDTFANEVILDLDMGAGIDTIDASAQGPGGLKIRNWQGAKMETVETIIGSAYDDTISALSSVGSTGRTAPLTVAAGAGDDTIVGSEGPDTIVGGGGTDHIAGKAGDDVIVVSGPFPGAETDLDGGAGKDQLIMQGTSGDDALEIGGFPGNFWAFNLDNAANAYHAVNVERARLDLGEGNDFAFISDQLVTTRVVGGAGSDQVIVDAFKATASITTVDALTRISIPLADKTPIVNLSEVEQYAIADETVIGTAPTPGGGPHVRTFRIDGTPVANFYAYDARFMGGVTLGLGDLNADADDEIITAAGPGGGPHVRVFYSDGTDTGVSFYAYDPAFNGGVSVAAIDLDGDGFDEIVTAPAKNAEPRVRIWTGDGQLITEWNAQGFGTTGINVARGAHLGRFGGDEILVSSADGAQSVVRAYEADGSLAPQYDPYVPYGAFTGGASVSRGEFKGVGGNANLLVSDEIITGAGVGGGPIVRVVQRAATGRTLNPIGAFYAYAQSYTGGVEVSACNPDGGNDEIVTVPAHGRSPLVRIFNLDGSIKRRGFYAYDAAFTNGIRVACGGAISRFFGVSAQEAKPPASPIAPVSPKGVSAAHVAAS